MTRRIAGLTLATLVFSLGACDRSKAQLEQTLQQVQQISSEKDSLLKDVMETSQFIAEVNSELAKVRSRTAGRPVQGRPGEMESNLTPTQQREAIKARVTELTARALEPFRGEGLHLAMYLIPALGSILALVLFAGSRTLPRDAESLQRWMRGQAAVP